MDKPRISTARALDALCDWLLTENAAARGAVADEVLHRQQDHVSRLFGPHTVLVTHTYLREHLAQGGQLASLARDRAQLAKLLQHIKSKRRRGFEQHRQVVPQTTESDPRPSALLVMAEHHTHDPVWNRPAGDGGPVRLHELGVSEPLLRRLQQWNDTFGKLALTDFEWESHQAEAVWVQQGLQLAHELQQELPDIDVRYFHADDDRPLRSL